MPRKNAGAGFNIDNTIAIITIIIIAIGVSN